MGGPPGQSQQYPGETGEMDPQPHDEMRGYEGRGLLAGKRALITGGDSGIGRAVSAAFAKEGADLAITYLNEDGDARHTAGLCATTDVRRPPGTPDLPGDRWESRNGERAQARLSDDTVFLARFPHDLKIAAAGCEPRSKGPCDCKVEARCAPFSRLPPPEPESRCCGEVAQSGPDLRRKCGYGGFEGYDAAPVMCSSSWTGASWTAAREVLASRGL